MTRLLILLDDHSFLLREDPAPPAVLVDALRAGRLGEFSPGDWRAITLDGLVVLVSRLANFAEPLAPPGGKAQPGGETARRISPRSREILVSLIAGRTISETAYDLGITYGSVRRHLQKIKSALRASTLEQAIARAVALGIVDGD